MKNAWSRYIVAAFAGLLFAGAFPNFNIAGLAWLAPALMIFSAQGTRGWETFRVGYIAGLSFWLATLYWILLIPASWYPVLGWIALSAFIALYFGVWMWIVSGAKRLASGETWAERLLWSLGGATAWVALEMIRARLLGGFPWNLLGVSQLRILPLVQIASVTGVYGISFLVVWTSLSLFNAAVVILRQPTRRFAWQAEIILPALALTGAFTFGMFQLRESASTGATLRVTFIQPSIPQTAIWDPAENAHRFSQLIALSEKAVADGTDLLLWPEAALPEFDDANYAAITNLIRTQRVWMILGADDVLPHPASGHPENVDYFNAAFLFNPDGEFVSAYHKRNLVIFGEYIPLVRWLPFLKWFTTITGSYAAGNTPVTFELDSLVENAHASPNADTNGLQVTLLHHRLIQTSPLICYEDMFPQLGRSSANDDVDFLVNLTNDGWFGESAEQWQHANAAAFRAIENGLPLLRCCNNGVTCWIDSCGRMREVFRDNHGSVYGAGSMTVEVPLRDIATKRGATFYNQHGDWFGWSCVGITLLMLVNKTMKRRSNLSE